MGSSSPVIETPCSGLFNHDKEKEKIFLNSIGKVDFKDLFMESLSPEFLKLFQENKNLFYSQPFYEAISYEYGLFGKSKNTNKAFKIYKDAADFKSDYLCMYRMYRIFLTDYEEFDIKKNEDLYRLYLYKCFAFLPIIIMEGTYCLLNKIEVGYYRNMPTIDTKNDIELMQNVLKSYFNSDSIKENIEILDSLLEFETGDNAYYAAQLKYCHFYYAVSWAYVSSSTGSIVRKKPGQVKRIAAFYEIFACFCGVFAARLRQPSAATPTA